MKKIYAFILGIAITTLTIGCSGLSGDNLLYAGQLTSAISQEYEAQRIEIKITNNKSLSVTLVNIELKGLASSEKEKIAMDIGRIVRSRERNPEIESGVVNFVEKSNYLVASTTTSESFDMFLQRGVPAQNSSNNQLIR